MLRFGCAVSALFALAGCVGPGAAPKRPEAEAFLRSLPRYEPPSRAAAAQAAETEGPEPGGELTLRQALAAALLRNPRLRSVSWEIRAAEARWIQAGLLPNPTIEVETEQAAGTGDLSGFKGAETTLRLSQLVLLGGKRAKLLGVRALETGVASWDYEIERVAVFTGTALAFIDLLAAQERVRIAENLEELARETLEAAKARVEAGETSILEELRASVDAAAARIDVVAARRRLEAARKRLASQWGGLEAGFSRALGNLYNLSAPVAFESLAELTERNPQVVRWAAEIERRLAVSAFERSRAVPDLVVMGGVQRIEETDDYGLTFGFALGLPIFDRNQGRILEAGYRIRQARDERLGARVRVRAALAAAYETFSAAYDEATTLSAEVLPAARRSFEAAREGYAQGKFTYLEVLDAQKTLFAVRNRYLDAVWRYQSAGTVIEALTGAEIVTPGVRAGTGD